MIKTMRNKSTQKALFVMLVGLLVFQSPLETVYSKFSYIDELVALAGACLGLYDVVAVRRGRPDREQLMVALPLLMFVAVGLAGNVLYRYQPIKPVIVDLYTNLKFFFAIGTGYYLFRSLDWQEKKETACRCAKIFTLFLFVLFILDRIFHIWPGEIRYGIASAKLFYFHPTYLAGAMALLVTLLTVFYEKKNLPFIVMALVMMAFTLRAKSLASAALYAAMFVFFCVWKKELKLWHVGAAGAGCLAIAWNKIRYYFFELAGASARSVMTGTSVRIMKEYFPIGTGFATFGSAEAGKNYSPVYMQYGFYDNYELRDVKDVENTMRMVRENEELAALYRLDPEYVLNDNSYLCDHFWPTIFGQTGFLGTVAYVFALATVLLNCLKMKKCDLYAYVGALFAMAYLFIS